MSRVSCIKLGSRVTPWIRRGAFGVPAACRMPEHRKRMNKYLPHAPLAYAKTRPQPHSTPNHSERKSQCLLVRASSAKAVNRCTTSWQHFRRTRVYSLNMRSAFRRCSRRLTSLLSAMPGNATESPGVQKVEKKLRASLFISRRKALNSCSLQLPCSCPCCPRIVL